MEVGSSHYYKIDFRRRTSFFSTSSSLIWVPRGSCISSLSLGGLRELGLGAVCKDNDALIDGGGAKPRVTIIAAATTSTTEPWLRQREREGRDRERRYCASVGIARPSIRLC